MNPTNSGDADAKWEKLVEQTKMKMKGRRWASIDSDDDFYIAFPESLLDNLPETEKNGVIKSLRDNQWIEVTDDTKPMSRTTSLNSTDWSSEGALATSSRRTTLNSVAENSVSISNVKLLNKGNSFRSNSSSNSNFSLVSHSSKFMVKPLKFGRFSNTSVQSLGDSQLKPQVSEIENVVDNTIPKAIASDALNNLFFGIPENLLNNIQQGIKDTLLESNITLGDEPKFDVVVDKTMEKLQSIESDGKFLMPSIVFGQGFSDLNEAFNAVTDKLVDNVLNDLRNTIVIEGYGGQAEIINVFDKNMQESQLCKIALAPTATVEHFYNPLQPTFIFKYNIDFNKKDFQVMKQTLKEIIQQLDEEYRKIIENALYFSSSLDKVKSITENIIRIYVILSRVYVCIMISEIKTGPTSSSKDTVNSIQQRIDSLKETLNGTIPFLFGLEKRFI